MEEKYTSHVVLKAGLGNQMFMIANGYAYSLRNKTKFSITETWSGISRDRPSYWNTFFSDLKKYATRKNIGKVYKEKEWSYSYIPNLRRDVSFKGYFQSEEYFIDYRNEILDLFKFPSLIKEFVNKKKLELNLNNEVPTVAIHIRRGDYLKLRHIHYVLPLRYFLNAQRLIEEKLKVKPRYIYFSNDIKWIRENFEINDNDVVVEGNKDYEDLALMSQCDHFIISNSSFSWWAAYLGYYEKLKEKSLEEKIKNSLEEKIKNSLEEKIKNSLEEKNKIFSSIVIAPDIWFNYAGPKNWYSIYPSEWSVIDSRGYKLEDVFFMGILSCEKYKDRRDKQKLDNFLIEYRYFIGNPELKENEFIEDIENKIVYVPCSDNYESLPQKVVLMLKWILKNKSIVRYIIKSDDDVKFNYIKFKDYCSYVATNNLDYTGYKTRNKSGLSEFHLGKPEDEKLSKTKIRVPNVDFCAGPCYFLSKKASRIIIDHLFEDYTILEDVSIGNCLHKHNIFPYHLNIKGSGCDWV